MNNIEKLNVIAEKCRERIIETERLRKSGGRDIDVIPYTYAEAGWRSTIAAIGAAIELKAQIDQGWIETCKLIGISDPHEENATWPKPLEEILTAWEGLV